MISYLQYAQRQYPSAKRLLSLIIANGPIGISSPYLNQSTSNSSKHAKSLRSLTVSLAKRSLRIDVF